MLPSVNRELLDALANERKSVIEFVELLRREQGFLTENDIEPLLILAEQKSAHAVKLNALSDLCRQQLTKISPALNNAEIEAWFKKNSTEGLAMWQEVRVLAEQAKQINNVNGELIQMKLRNNQQTFAALSRAVSQANLYGADGQTSYSPGSGRSLGSV